MTRTAGRSTLKRLEAIEALAGEVLVLDARQTQAAAEVPIEIDDETQAALAEVFGGMDLLSDPEKVRLLVGIRFEIRKNWADARDAFLAIGRALVALDDMLTAAEKKQLKTCMERLFPFSAAVASKLRAVARAVDGGRIPRGECPGSYATAYLLSTMSDQQIDAARECNLIRVDVTRREIEGFRASARVTAVRIHRPVTLAGLRAEEARLGERIRTILTEAVRLRVRRREIGHILTRSQD